MATAIKPLFDKPVIDKVKKAIGGGDSLDDRKVYPDLAQARAAFNAAKAHLPEGFIAMEAPDEVFFKHTVTTIPAVVDKKGNETSPAREERVMTDERESNIYAAVAVVGTRQRNDATQKMDSGIKALVLFAIPSTEAFLDSENGTSWVVKVVEKEAAHVNFRGLRNAETVEEFSSEFASMPSDVDAIVTSHARESSFDSAAFDTMWKPFRDQLKTEMPKLYDALPQKADVLRAIRSKPYAVAEYPKFEAANVFVFVAKQLIEQGPAWTKGNGEPDPQDVSAIESWVAGRETLDLRKAQVDESFLDGLDLGFGEEPGNEGGANE